MRLLRVCGCLAVVALLFAVGEFAPAQEEGAKPPSRRGGPVAEGSRQEFQKLMREMGEIRMQLLPVQEQVLQTDSELSKMQQEIQELREKLREKQQDFESKIAEKIRASFPDYADLVDKLTELRNKLKEMMPERREGRGGAFPGAGRRGPPPGEKKGPQPPAQE